jgi:hypothetical protein
MTFKYPVQLEFNNQQLEALLQHDKVNGYSIWIDDYELETAGFHQNWEISDQAYAAKGNKFGFKLTGTDYEIAELKITFSIPKKLLSKEGSSDIKLTISIENRGYQLFAELEIKELGIRSVGDDLENAFIQLSQTLAQQKQRIPSCFGCALSGHERGGSSLFCMKESREQLLSMSYQEGYQQWFDGMQLESIVEFHECDAYEYIASRNKY